MTDVQITIIICVATFALSVGTSLFITGAKWGAINKDIDYIKRDLDTIRSLFQLTLIGQVTNKDGH